MRLTAKRAAALVGGLLALVSFARVATLFLESLASVREERIHDAELLDLCASGLARGSMKMRAACLQAQADKASPLVLKALLRAFKTAFDDFSESVSSPGKVLVVVLFVLSSLFLPVSAWARALLPSDGIEPGSHVVVLASDPAEALGRRAGFRQKVQGALRMRGRKRQSRIVEIEDGEERPFMLEVGDKWE